MKVTGSSPTSPVLARQSSTPRDRGFTAQAAEDAAPTASPARAGALAAVSTLDALLALQESLTPVERRRRAVRRGKEILDALDDLKLTLLDESGDEIASVLERLQRAIRQARNDTDDPGLDDVLEQIEVRAAVELAKRETVGIRRSAAHRPGGEIGAI